MTKAELVQRVKLLEEVNEELDDSLDKALKDNKELKSELSFLRTIIEDEGIVTLDDIQGQYFDEDGELSKNGLKMLIKAGMGRDDVEELIAKGDEIVGWLKRKGIKLDSGGNLDKN